MSVPWVLGTTVVVMCLPIVIPIVLIHSFLGTVSVSNIVNSFVLVLPKQQLWFPNSTGTFLVCYLSLAGNLDFRVSLLNWFVPIAGFPIKAKISTKRVNKSLLKSCFLYQFHLPSFHKLSDCICIWNIEQLNFSQVNVSYSIQCLEIFIPGFTVNLGCNYVRIIFRSTILSIYCFIFFLFHIIKRVYSHFLIIFH